MQVVVDDLLVSYQMAGQGKTLVLLHGWGDQGSGLHQLQGALAKKFRVITPDLPGFGASQAPSSAWGLTDYATFVGHFLDKLGARHLHAVVGHSNGGAIALRGLASGLQRADKLVLLASSGIRGENGTRRRILRSVAHIGKVLARPLPTSAQRALRRKLYHQIGSDLLVAEHLQESFKKIVADDVRADAATIRVPSLLIYGRNDQTTPPAYGEIFHRLLGDSRLEVLPHAGHFVFLDQPAEVLRLIKEFLQ